MGINSHREYPRSVFDHFLGNIVFAALLVAATARVNRLVTRDVITMPLRARLEQATGPLGRFASAVVSCQWCTGVYTGFAAAAYGHALTGWSWWYLPLTGLALAWGAVVAALFVEGE